MVGAMGSVWLAMPFVSVFLVFFLKRMRAVEGARGIRRVT